MENRTNNNTEPIDTKEKLNLRIAIQPLRAAIQAAFFILAPGLFITLFSAFGDIYKALIGGVFTFAEYGGKLALTVIALLLTLIWGRFFCGFICSFGAMQDLVRLLGKKLPFHPALSVKADKILKKVKFFVLAFVVLGVWTFALPKDSVWSPWTVFGASAHPWEGLPAGAVVLSLGGLLLLFTVIGSLFFERFFCKYLCPLGAIFSLVSRFRLFRIKRDASACSGRCRVCTRKCAMSIPLYETDQVTSGECINCMKCVAACPRRNITAQPAPAISGTAAAIAFAGMTFAGVLPTGTNTAVTAAGQTAQVQQQATGRYADGVYTGTAQGYKGPLSVSVTVKDGFIADITVLSAKDDKEFLSLAQNGVISAILNTQNVSVDTVSGATFSSRGIIGAVTDALGAQLTAETATAPAATEAVSESAAVSAVTEPTAAESTSAAVTEPSTQTAAEAYTTTEPQTAAQTTQAPETTTQAHETTAYAPETTAPAASGAFSDGVYTGSGSGLRGSTYVRVTVENGRITDITVTSYEDDSPYFSRAESGVIPAILSAQGVNVSTVSGATFSSNSILEAVADALGLDFTNTNSSSGGRGRK